MARKNFKDNPALQFISTAGTDEEAAPETKANKAAAAPSAGKVPAGYKINPLYVETKSRRLQLVLQPSLYERVKHGAAQSGLSVNEYIHRILDKETPRKGN